MTESELRKEIERLEEIVDSTQSTIRCLQQQLAVLTADFKIGDRVSCENIVGVPFEIVRVLWKYNGCTYYGRRVLKSDLLGEQVHELWGKIKLVQGDRV